MITPVIGVITEERNRAILTNLSPCVGFRNVIGITAIGSSNISVSHICSRGFS